MTGVTLEELVLSAQDGQAAAVADAPRTPVLRPVIAELLKGRPVGEARTIAILKSWQDAYQHQCDDEAAEILATP